MGLFNKSPTPVQTEKSATREAMAILLFSLRTVEQQDDVDRLSNKELMARIIDEVTRNS